MKINKHAQNFWEAFITDSVSQSFLLWGTLGKFKNVFRTLKPRLVFGRTLLIWKIYYIKCLRCVKVGIQSLVLTGFWMVENLEDRRWSGVLIVVEIKTKLLPFCKKKHLKTQPNGCNFVRIFSFQISPLLVYLIFQRSRFQMFPDFEWSDLGFPQYS